MNRKTLESCGSWWSATSISRAGFHLHLRQTLLIVRAWNTLAQDARLGTLSANVVALISCTGAGLPMGWEPLRESYTHAQPCIFVRFKLNGRSLNSPILHLHAFVNRCARYVCIPIPSFMFENAPGHFFL